MNGGIENCLKNIVYMESLIKSKEKQLKKLKGIAENASFEPDDLTPAGKQVQEHIKRLSEELQEEYVKFLHTFEYAYHEIKKLPIDYRSAFEAHYLDGETWKETADELFIGERQIYRKRNKGLELLRLREMENKEYLEV